MFIGKGVLKLSSKFTEEHPCRSAFSIKFLCNFIEITFWHGCSPVNLLHIFTTSFPKNISGGLLLYVIEQLVKDKLHVSAAKNMLFFWQNGNMKISNLGGNLLSMSLSLKCKLSKCY